MRRRTIQNENIDIAPDEIFLDARNIPEFDVQQFEGRLETPIKKSTIILLSAAFLFIGVAMLARAAVLQIIDGERYVAMSAENRLEHQILFPERGVISDRKGVELAWNTPAREELGFSLREYFPKAGFAHVLGFLHYPARDRHGVYYRKDYEAKSGVEAFYNERLKGKTGLRIIETDALGNVISSNVIDPPIPGEDLRLSIDARVQEKFHEVVGRVAREEDYLGGAGAIMDIESGELLALVSYPEFDPNVMTSGDDAAAIARWNADKRTPFLNRAVSGLYTPGSIVKPMFAAGALAEGIITPNTSIESKGYIAIPHPYIPDEETRFNDWKAHGWLDVREALAQSSNVFFYELAGGYKQQKGLGIANIEKYARLFGFGTTTGIDMYGEEAGTVPDPEWKALNFPDDPTWRIGDTYFTGIGQYGMQATVLQAATIAATIASKGTVAAPHLFSAAATSSRRIGISEDILDVVGEGMRRSATRGTANLLNIPGFAIAAKTGTAELGVAKTRVNSWVIGFFPYEKPRYAFAVVMDRGVRGNTTNASYVAQQLFWWMLAETPEYVRDE